MATYYVPQDNENGDFVSAEYWNRQFGGEGSIVYLYKEYLKKTRGYHVKLTKSYTQSMNSSWVMTDTTSNIVTWNYAAIDYYPNDGESCWDVDNPNTITIQESGFYNVNVYLNMFNSTVPVTSLLYGHIIRQIEENNIITIATDHARNPVPKTSGLIYPTFANRLSEFVLSINTIHHFDANDIIYVRLQPSVDIYDDSSTSFIGKYLVNVPTYYQGNGTRGSIYYLLGTQYSFVNSGYVGMTPSFFEVASIRLDD